MFYEKVEIVLLRNNYLKIIYNNNNIRFLY